MYVHTIHNTPTQEYKEVFEPLLLEEAGAQVLRGIEEGAIIEPHPAVVAACSKVRRPRCWLAAQRQQQVAASAGGRIPIAAHSKQHAAYIAPRRRAAAASQHSHLSPRDWSRTTPRVRRAGR